MTTPFARMTQNIGVALVSALPLLGCRQQDIAEAMFSSAYRPPKVERRSPSAASPTSHFLLLAGDMHCHVTPPDDTTEVTRGLDETLDLARSEGLDFVVLTPHVWSRFFTDSSLRSAVSESQSVLRKAIAKKAAADVVLIPGFEYTDHRYGHVGVAFAEVDAVLAKVPLAEAQRHPERFFEEWVSEGGLLTVNHPFVTPLDSIVPIARANLSWRPFTAEGPFPPEIRRISELAQSYEVFNLTATELRDRWLLGERDRTLNATFAALDRLIPNTHRRMTPVGGSDSHGHHLRATTFVLSERKDASAIRDAVKAGRTCVRDPAACSFEVRQSGTEWKVAGASFDGDGDLEVRAHGDSIHILLDGDEVASPSSDEIVRVAIPKDRCSVVRAEVDDGYSGPIYAHCGITTEPQSP